VAYFFFSAFMYNQTDIIPSDFTPSSASNAAYRHFNYLMDAENSGMQFVAGSVEGTKWTLAGLAIFSTLCSALGLVFNVDVTKFLPF